MTPQMKREKIICLDKLPESERPGVVQNYLYNLALDNTKIIPTNRALMQKFRLKKSLADQYAREFNKNI
jgi:hypothetical protein